MPVIINMEMPKGCEIADHTLKDGVRDCPLSPICTAHKKEILKHGTLGDHIIDYYPPNCPIIGEIPTQHGRLIDADEAKELIVHAFTCSKKLTINDILGLIDNAPTIVEASE